MGSQLAKELAQMSDRELAMYFHLVGNHYPPIPAVMIPICLDAIDAVNAGDENKLIRLPFDGMRDGKPFQVLFRGSPDAPAKEIVRAHHLDGWINCADDCECLGCTAEEQG